MRSAQVFGINLDEHLKVSDLVTRSCRASFEFRESPTGALVGKVLADRLQLEVGNSFLLDVQGQLRRYG